MQLFQCCCWTRAWALLFSKNGSLVSEQINYFCTAFPRIGWICWLTWVSSAGTDLHLRCWRRSSVVSVAWYRHYQGPLGTQCFTALKDCKQRALLSKRTATEAKEHFVHTASSVFTEPNESNFDKEHTWRARTSGIPRPEAIQCLACWDRVQAEWAVIFVCCNTCIGLCGSLPLIIPGFIHNVCCTISGFHLKKI